MSSRPSWHYISSRNRWELRGKNGTLINTVPDNNSAMGKMTTFVGTSAAIAAVGTGNVVTGTITNATGLAVGDIVFANPKSTLSSNIGIAGFHMPTTNTLNVYFQNALPATVASQAAVGWDVFAIRPI